MNDLIVCQIEVEKVLWGRRAVILLICGGRGLSTRQGSGYGDLEVKRTFVYHREVYLIQSYPLKMLFKHSKHCDKNIKHSNNLEHFFFSDIYSVAVGTFDKI